MSYVVKIYDPLGTVPASYRSARNTWVMSPPAEPLRVFATERAASAFIAVQGPFTALEMCIETPPANLMNSTQEVSISDAPTLPLRRVHANSGHRPGEAFLELGSVDTTADAAL